MMKISGDYRKTITPTEDTTVTINYTAHTGNDMWFYEHDGGYTTRTSCSNGSAAASNNGIEVTVPEDGIYTITVNAYAGAADRSMWVYKNSKDGELLASVVEDPEKKGDGVTIYAPGQDIVATSIELTTSDKIYILGSASTAYVDYVLLEKTGEISVEPGLPEDVTVASGGENVNEGHEDAASMWQALVNGTGKSYSKVTANVTLKNDGGSKSATVDTNTVVTGGDVNIIVVVNKLVDDIEKIVISVE